MAPLDALDRVLRVLASTSHRRASLGIPALQGDRFSVWPTQHVRACSMAYPMNLLEVAESIGVHGFLHCEELQKLVELAANRDVLEIGSFRGLSAWGMGITARTITCVDTFKAATDGQRQSLNLTTLDDFRNSVRRYGHLVWHEETSEQAAERYRGSSFDMIFIDATHTKPEARADIDRWWPKVRPGGVLVLHDYRHADFPGVEQAADEVFGPAPEGTTLVTLRWIVK